MKILFRLSCLALTASALASPAARAQGDYIVHEWGTFTSVQGGDGELLPWRPLQTSELPGFVHNWNQPGLNRNALAIVRGGKGGMVTLQRMETPVIYFYSRQDMTADVSVNFPKGFITEWYPQAAQIGPSFPLNTNIPCNSTLTESRAVWKHLRLIAPGKNSSDLAGALPEDNTGKRYFAARETGSDFVQTEVIGPTNTVTETDKFIFYRGAGSFRTTLRVSVDAADDVSVVNTGREKLGRLFLVSIRDDGHGKTAGFTTLDGVAPGDSVPCPRLHAEDFLPLENFQSGISAQMQAALVEAGLFKAEAAAMVNTWKDSWFAEPGDRVLYLLPRPWTDETLPLTLNPKPANLVRVMVGRAEMITPKTTRELSANLSRAVAGDAAGRALAAQEIKDLGRFAEPALYLVNFHNPATNAVELSYQLLYEGMRTATEPKFN